MLQQTQVVDGARLLRALHRALPRRRARSRPRRSATCSPPGAASATTRARAICIAARRSVVAEHGGAFPRTSAALAAAARHRPLDRGGDRGVLLRRARGDPRRQRQARAGARARVRGRSRRSARRARALGRARPRSCRRRDIEAYTPGLMDLGATVCLTRSPHCLLCPARDLCAAARAGTQERYPIKTRRMRARPARATCGSSCAGASGVAGRARRERRLGRALELARARFVGGASTR